MFINLEIQPQKGEILAAVLRNRGYEGILIAMVPSIAMGIGSLKAAGFNDFLAIPARTSTLRLIMRKWL
jgi:hypothetical protein